MDKHRCDHGILLFMIEAEIEVKRNEQLFTKIVVKTSVIELVCALQSHL